MKEVFEYYQGRVDMTCRNADFYMPWNEEGLKEFCQKIPSKSQAFDEFFTMETEGPRYGLERLDPQAFEIVWSNVDRTKSPGSPLVYISAQNGGLEDRKAEILDVVQTRISNLIALGRKVHKVDYGYEMFFTPEEFEARGIAIDMVAQGYTDCVLVGPKGEPRKIGKKPRLVSQVSLVSNLIARLIFGDALMDEQASDNPYIAVGLDLVTPEKREELFTKFAAASKEEPLNSNDIQGWEYAVRARERWADFCRWCWQMELVDDQFDPLEGKEKHFYALLGYFVTVIYRVVQLPCGAIVVPPYGQMSSGELTTFSSNSFMRSWLANRASEEVHGIPVNFTNSAGDDNLSSGKKVGAAWFAANGFILTDQASQDATTGFSFCSTTFKEGETYGDNIEKAQYNIIINSRFDINDRVQFAAMYGCHPEYPRILAELFARFPVSGTQ